MMAALMGGDDVASSVLFPDWICSTVEPAGDVALDLTVYSLGALHPSTRVEIGRSLGSYATAPPTTTVVSSLVGDILGVSPYETTFTSYEAGQYSWFVRYTEIGGGTAESDWFKFPVTDPGCGEPEGGGGGGGGGGDPINPE